MVKSSMNGIDSEDAADGPVVSAGGRSPSALSTGQGDMGTGTARLGPLAPGQRWSVARKREVVLRLLHGASAELLSRELGVPIYKLEQWRRKADAALEGAVKEGVGAPSDGALAAALRRVGDASMEHERVRARAER